MAEWLAQIPLSDNLCGAGSGVFKFVGQQGNNYNSFYVCQLCSRHEKFPETFCEFSSSHDQRKSHVKDVLHVQRASELVQKRDAMVSRLHWSLPHLDAALYFRSLPFHDDLLRRILAGDAPSQGTVEKRLKELVVSEPLVLLELALWKTACLLSPPSDRGLGGPLEWMAWYQGRWTSQKASARRDPLTSVVVTLVAPFLGLKKKKFEKEAEKDVPSAQRG